MKNSERKFVGFLKRNAGYLVLSFCILAIGLSTALIVLANNGEKVNPNEQLNNPIEDNTPVTGNDDKIPDVEVNAPVDPEPEVPEV